MGVCYPSSTGSIRTDNFSCYPEGVPHHGGRIIAPWSIIDRTGHGLEQGELIRAEARHVRPALQRQLTHRALVHGIQNRKLFNGLCNYSEVVPR